MKKILSAAVALFMTLTVLLGIPSVNAETLPTCTVRVEGLTGTIAEGSASGKTQIEIFEKVMNDKQIKYKVSKYGDDIYVNSINGLDAGTFDKNDGWMYYVKSKNGVSNSYPYTPQNGDEIIYYYGSGYGDSLTPFVNTIAFAPEVVVPGQKFTMKFAYTSKDWQTNKDVVKPISGANVKIDGAGYTTGSDGSIAVDSLSNGQHTYKISGYKGNDKVSSVVMDEGTFTVDGKNKPGINYTDADYYNTFKDNTKVSKDIDGEIKYISSKLASVSNPWAAVDMKKIGLNFNSDYISDIKDDVNGGNLSSIYATTLEKYIIGLTAAGYTPYNFCGHDLVSELLNRDINSYGINDAIFGLAAYSYANIPENYKIKKTDLVNKILSSKISYTENGESCTGWDLNGNKADADLTGAAINVLAPFCASNSTVKNTVDAAEKTLSQIENESGYITGTYGASCETNAFAIMGLVSAGMNPEDGQFKEEKGDLVSALISFKGTDGEYRHQLGGSNNMIATEEALRALIAVKNFKSAGYDYYASSIDAEKLPVYAQSSNENTKSSDVKQNTDNSDVKPVSSKISLPKTGSNIDSETAAAFGVALIAAGLVLVTAKNRK